MARFSKWYRKPDGSQGFIERFYKGGGTSDANKGYEANPYGYAAQKSRIEAAKAASSSEGKLSFRGMGGNTPVGRGLPGVPNEAPVSMGTRWSRATNWGYSSAGALEGPWRSPSNVYDMANNIRYGNSNMSPNAGVNWKGNAAGAAVTGLNVWGLLNSDYQTKTMVGIPTMVYAGFKGVQDTATAIGRVMNNGATRPGFWGQALSRAGFGRDAEGGALTKLKAPGVAGAMNGLFAIHYGGQAMNAGNPYEQRSGLSGLAGMGSAMLTGAMIGGLPGAVAGFGVGATTTMLGLTAPKSTAEYQYDQAMAPLQGYRSGLAQGAGIMLDPKTNFFQKNAIWMSSMLDATFGAAGPVVQFPAQVTGAPTKEYFQSQLAAIQNSVYSASNFTWSKDGVSGFAQTSANITSAGLRTVGVMYQDVPETGRTVAEYLSKGHNGIEMFKDSMTDATKAIDPYLAGFGKNQSFFLSKVHEFNVAQSYAHAAYRDQGNARAALNFMDARAAQAPIALRTDTKNASSRIYNAVAGFVNDTVTGWQGILTQSSGEYRKLQTAFREQGHNVQYAAGRAIALQGAMRQQGIRMAAPAGRMNVTGVMGGGGGRGSGGYASMRGEIERRQRVEQNIRDASNAAWAATAAVPEPDMLPIRYDYHGFSQGIGNPELMKAKDWFASVDESRALQLGDITSSFMHDESELRSNHQAKLKAFADERSSILKSGGTAREIQSGLGAMQPRANAEMTEFQANLTKINRAMTEQIKLVERDTDFKKKNQADLSTLSARNIGYQQKAQMFNDVQGGIQIQKGILRNRLQNHSISTATAILGEYDLDQMSLKSSVAENQFYLGKAQQDLQTALDYGASPQEVAAARSAVAARQGVVGQLQNMMKQDTRLGDLTTYYAGKVQGYLKPYVSQIAQGISSGNIKGMFQGIGKTMLSQVGNWATGKASRAIGGMMAAARLARGGNGGVQQIMMPMTGIVKSVHDGDTFTLDNGTKIRMSGIDAPELGQQMGGWSQEQLSNSILGQEVTVNPTGTSYDRTVGSVYLNGEDVGANMVRSGAAFEELSYSHGAYADQSAVAKQLGVGVFGPQGQGMMAPAAYRASQKGVGSLAGAATSMAGVLGKGGLSGIGPVANGAQYAAMLKGGSGVGKLAQGLGKFGKPLFGAKAVSSLAGKSGVLGKLAGNFQKAGGFSAANIAGGAVGGIAAGFANNAIYKNQTMAGQIGAGVGSLVGGIVGQALIPIPFVGAAIGAFVGGMIGGLGNLFGGGDKKKQEAMEKRHAYQDNELKPYLDKLVSSINEDSTYDEIARKMTLASRGMKANGERGMEMKREAMRNIQSVLTAMAPYKDLYNVPGGAKGALFDADLRQNIRISGLSPFSGDQAGDLMNQYRDLNKAIGELGKPTAARTQAGKDLFTNIYNQSSLKLGRMIGDQTRDNAFLVEDLALDARQRGITAQNFEYGYQNFERDSRRQLEQMLGTAQRKGNRAAYIQELLTDQQHQRSVLDQQRSLLTDTNDLEGRKDAAKLSDAQRDLQDMIASQASLSAAYTELLPKVGDLTDEFVRMSVALKEVNKALGNLGR